MNFSQSGLSQANLTDNNPVLFHMALGNASPVSTGRDQLPLAFQPYYSLISNWLDIMSFSNFTSVNKTHIKYGEHEWRRFFTIQNKDYINLYIKLYKELPQPSNYKVVVLQIRKLKLKSFCVSLSDPFLLHKAVTHGFEKLAELVIMHKANIETKDRYSSITALMCAAQEGHKECVQLLIHHKADINEVDSCYQTAIAYAAAAGHLNIVRMLFENNADIECRNPLHGATLLMRAMENDFICGRGKNCSPEVVSLLIQLRANINAVDNLGYTVLIRAVRGSEFQEKNYQTRVVKILLNEGGMNTLNTGDRLSIKTPLMYALNDINLVRMLIEHRADVEATSFEGRTALDFARSWSTTIEEHEVIKILAKAKRDAELRRRKASCILS